MPYVLRRPGGGEAGDLKPDCRLADSLHLVYTLFWANDWDKPTYRTVHTTFLL